MESVISTVAPLSESKVLAMFALASRDCTVVFPAHTSPWMSRFDLCRNDLSHVQHLLLLCRDAAFWSTSFCFSSIASILRFFASALFCLSSGRTKCHPCQSSSDRIRALPLASLVLPTHESASPQNSLSTLTRTFTNRMARKRLSKI